MILRDRKLQEIGSYFGIGESGVTQASRRTGIKAGKDSKLRKTIKLLEKKDDCVNCVGLTPIIS